MADETTSRCVFVTTNNDTHLALLLNKCDSVLVFKEKISKDHQLCFPTFGKIFVSALKVKSGGQVYHLPDSMILSQAFQAIGNKDWFLTVDVMSVEDKAGELLTRKTAASSNPAPALPTLITHGPEEKSTKKRKSQTGAISNKSHKKPALGDVSSGKGEVVPFATESTGKVMTDLEKILAHTLELVDALNESHNNDEFVSGTIAKAPTATANRPTDEMYQTTVDENQGRVDATSEPMLIIKTEIGSKDIVEKAGEEVKSVKPKKKKKVKAPAKEVASSSQIVESPPAEVTKEDPPESLDNIVKKIVEEA